MPIEPSAGSSSRARVLYIEPFSGISGDMMLGALLDLGAGFERLKSGLGKLPLQGYHLAMGACGRAGVRATRFDVHLDHHASHREGHHHHRTFRDIRELIRSSGLSDWVKTHSIDAFAHLAQAEGLIHQRAPEDVHFHEVGALDSIVDIVGCMIALEEFLPLRVISSQVNVGHGTLECQHGIYPVPGPATQELLKGIPTFSNEVGGELTTPTGAALLRTLAERFGPRPAMLVQASGYGAGSRDMPRAANVLRLSLGELVEESEVGPSAPDRVVVIEAAVDDMSPQVYGYFQERAFARGALDVYATPVQMKKNRPGILITVVGPADKLESLAEVLFWETSTIGTRYYYAARKTLEREVVEVKTRYGVVPIKVSRREGQRMQFSPEYESCRTLAEQLGVPLKDILAEAVRAYLERDSEVMEPRTRNR